MQGCILAQTVRRPTAANYIGQCAYSNSHIDGMSFIANQAALAQIKNSAISVYSERRYMLAELSYNSAAFVLPTSSGNFGIKGGYFGEANYNEIQAGLAYGRKLGSKIDMGVQFNYYGINVAGYGNAASISVEAGIIMHLTDKLNAGVHVFNPTGAKFGKNANEKLPFIYTAGLGYEGSESFYIGVEIEKEQDFPVNVKPGIQYKILKQLFARIGIATVTSNYWFGAGLLLGNYRIDATASHHPQLGIMPGLLLAYYFHKSKNKDQGE